MTPLIYWKFLFISVDYLVNIVYHQYKVFIHINDLICKKGLMAMIKIIAKNMLKEGQKENFIKLAEELIEKSRKEEGCISYGLFEDINDNSVVTFIEEWKDEKAIEQHNNSEHFKRIIPLLAELRINKENNLYREI